MAARKVPVLIVDGVNNHDWQIATTEIRRILDATGRFAVDVSTSPPREAPPSAWEAWHPDFKKYRAVIVNFNGGHLENGIHWPKPLEQSFEIYLERGGGMVSYHAANNSFPKWEAYNEMICLGWRPIDSGPEIVIDEKENLVVIPPGQGLKPGHGPGHDFEITVRDPRHPITSGLPKKWIHPNEQLTHGQHAPMTSKMGKVEKEIRILTYAWSKDSKRNEPMDWVRKWGKGRIYVTMQGHTWPKTPITNLQDPGFQSILARGVEWAATGAVSLPAFVNRSGGEVRQNL